MSRSRPILVVLVGLLLGAGIFGLERRAIARQRAELAELTRQNDTRARQLSALRRRRDGLARDTALAEQQLARIPAVSLAAAGPARTPDDVTVAAWHVRAERLRTLARENPASFIPEMKLLAPEDWLRVAQYAEFETDTQQRKALAALRTTAKKAFISQLSAAAQKWTTAFGSERPTGTVLDLLPYLSPPVDAPMLARYEIVPPPGEKRFWQAREIAPVDEEFDGRFSIEANGSWGSSGPGILTWQPDLQARVSRAYGAYRKDHPAVNAPSLADVVPYITPPLPAATLERMLNADRGGAK